MKHKVLIFTGKEHFIMNGEKEPYGSYDEKALMQIVNKIFNSDFYDVEIIDYPKCNCFYNINEIWKEVRTPILIGYKEGASYIEPIKNYKRKYLISPMVFPNSFNEPANVDEYEEENTICLFGGDKKSMATAKIYEKCYQYTHSEMTEDHLGLMEGMEQIAVFEAFIRMRNHI